jgi:peptide/nickel transport system ATP-binding protein
MKSSLSLANAAQPSPSSGVLSIKGLNVFFQQRGERIAAVRDVFLEVAAGESFGLVGESGSGKSTILRAIAGLVPDYTGTILVDGQEQSKGRAAKCGIQMVFQDPYGSLHPRFTVDRMLREALITRNFDRHDERIKEALHSVELPVSLRFSYPNQLSGGQRQRVAIARALVVNPAVLLLDEPTSALDVSIQAEILNLLRDMQQRRRVTFIFVSHDLPVVAHMCERVAIMKNGEIVEQVTSPDLRAGRVMHSYTRTLIDAAARLRGDDG